jgi:hypothetical protein
MTEADWLTSADPQKMIEFIRGSASNRKLRLFAVACCRQLWRQVKDQRHREAIQAAEDFADGAISLKNLAAARSAAWASAPGLKGGLTLVLQAARAVTAESAGLAARQVQRAVVSALARDNKPEIKRWQCGVFREIMGNPFRPAMLARAWLTDTVLSLAQTAYFERLLPVGHLDPHLLGVLGDALEEAGCSDAALLAHCRGPGPHTRGCWALDQILSLP